MHRMKRWQWSAAGALALVVAFVPMASAQVALVIGNSDYSPQCDPTWGDLPGVVGDVKGKGHAMERGGWNVVVMENLTKQEMLDAIEDNAPATSPDHKKKYIVWYAGHGDNTSVGEWVGVDCQLLSPVDLRDALVAAGIANHTLVILDSCGGGAFADAVNAIRPSVGFLTSTTGLECAEDDPSYTQCLLDLINGDGDIDQDGVVTVLEVANRMNAACDTPGQHGTWDNDFPHHILGTFFATAVTPATWGTIKGTF